MPSPLAFAALAGLVSAVLFATALSGSPLAMIATYFAPLPLFAAGLARGFVAASLAGLAGTLAIAVVGGVAFALPFALAFAAPTAILARQALLARPGAAGNLTWYPAGDLVVSLAVLALAVFGGALVVMGLGEPDVPAALENLVRATVATVNPALGERLTDADVAASAALLPGIAAATWMLMMAINGSLAQAVLGRRGWNVRPAGGFLALVLPGWFGAVVVVGVLGLWLADGWLRLAAGLAAFIGGLAHLLLGLAVVHATCRRWPWRTPALVGFYAMLVFVNQLTVPAVVLLGLAEPWLRLRERFAGGGKEE
ncbi:MAG: DUF2232 domain-containing protein [Alphaproteobacteria bacterium]